MISFGKAEWIPEMTNLWHQTFGDEKEYLDAFFSNIYKNENTLVYLENEKIAAILFMVPYCLKNRNLYEEAVYLYALATAPAFRGRKIMTGLIQRSIEISRKRGYAAMLLVPANNSLFQYYSRFGFQVCSDLVKISRSRNDLDKDEKAGCGLMMQEAVQMKIDLVRADTKQLWNAYKKSQYYMMDGIVLSELQNKFYYEELRKEGGEGFVFDLNGKLDGYLLLKYNAPILEILETNIDDKNLIAFYRALEEKYQFSRLLFYQPLCFDEAEKQKNKREFAMALNLKNNKLPKIFINRVLM